MILRYFCLDLEFLLGVSEEPIQILLSHEIGFSLYSHASCFILPEFAGACLPGGIHIDLAQDLYKFSCDG